MKTKNKKPFILGALIGCVLFSCNDQQQATLPATEPKRKPWIEQKQESIWHTTIPDVELIKGTETFKDGMAYDVSKPTITIYKPTKNNTGAAIIVFPGGGYNKVAVELEGAEICEWLADNGITGILLKYRVPGSGHHYDKVCHCGKDPIKPLALQDAQRTMSLVRSNAKQWQIDPNKIGVMGFSAGGHLVADVSTNYRTKAYAPTDDIDKVSCKPNFGIVFFPGHMLVHTDRAYGLNRNLPVDSSTPPTFILQAGNDPIDTIQNSLVYYIALKKAKVHAEYHVYAEGGHAFGLNRTALDNPNWHKLPIADWEALVLRWLQTIGMIATKGETAAKAGAKS
jgi:acetyl esterase/lipase